MFKNISRREKFLGSGTIGITLIALAYNFVMEPIVKRWDVLDSEVRSKEVLLTKNTRILRNKDVIEKVHSEYMKFFQKEKLTSEEESAIALSNIEKLARGTNVRITNIKPLAVKGFGDYNKFTFRVTTESRIDELTKFIYDLQSSEQLLKIERMVLRAKEREPDTIKGILHITKISVF
jgi:hypothetical protein